MADNVAVIKSMYDRFNARDIDGVLDALSDRVQWANAMEGGYVYGHDGVRDYWTRQWVIVSPHVEPKSFESAADGSVAVQVEQSILDVHGNPLHEHTNGLKDKTVHHVFSFEHGKVNRFDVHEIDASETGG